MRIRNIKVLIIFFLVNYSLITLGKSMDTLKYYKPLDDKFLGRNLYYFEDLSKSIKVKSALLNFKSGRFKKCKDQLEFYGGFSRSHFWLVLPIKNISSETLNLLWSFNTSDLEYVLYDGSNINHIFLMDSASSHKPLSLRSLPVRGVTFRVNLKPLQTRVLLVKVYPLNIDYVNFPTDITTEEDYFLWERDYFSSIYFYLGIFLIVMVANIFLGIFLSNKIHIWHAAAIFSLYLWNLNEFLLDSLIIPEWIFGYYSRIPKVFFLLLSIGLILTVFQVFTKQAKTHRYLFKIIQYYKYIIFSVDLILFFWIFIYTGNPPVLVFIRTFAFFLGIVGVLLSFLSIIMGILKKDRLSIVYAFTSIFLIVSVLQNQLYEWLDFNLFNVYPNNLCVSEAVEILLLTVLFAFVRKSELNELISLKIENSTKILNVLEEERIRIANDLHDELGGNLASISYNLRLLKLRPEQEIKIFSIVDKTAKRIREIAHDFMPPNLENTSLSVLLDNYFENINLNNTIYFDFFCLDEEEQLNRQQIIMIYRIIMELTANIIKHSYSTKATIQLIFFAKYVELISEDNGIGFHTSKEYQGLGLKSISSRVKYLNGEFSIDSNENGTTTMITIPYIFNL